MSFDPVNKIWRFDPIEEVYEPRRKKVRIPSWKAPEHVRLTSDMKSEVPKDNYGQPIPGREKMLVLDPRPTILLPPRRTKRPF